MQRAKKVMFDTCPTAVTLEHMLWSRRLYWCREEAMANTAVLFDSCPTALVWKGNVLTLDGYISAGNKSNTKHRCCLVDD